MHWAIWLVLAAIAIYAASYVWFAAQLIAYPFELDQGEGYDTWSASLLAHRLLPYTDNQLYPYFSSNYPPLWSAIVAIPVHWLGPTLSAGRAVSALAALLSAVLVGIAAACRLTTADSASDSPESERPGANRATVSDRAARIIAGVLGGGLFLASPYVFHTTPLARVNSLALLLALIALLAAQRPTRVRVLIAAVAILGALFTKPTAVDAALAGGAFVLLMDRRGGVLFVATITAAGAALVAALSAMTDGAFWLNVVTANANPFDFVELARYALNFAGLHIVLLIIAGAEVIGALRRRVWSPWVFFFITSAAMALGVGKWGAGESYLLGLIAAASVLAGGWLGRRLAQALPTHVGVALLVQMLLLAHGPLTDVFPVVADLGRQADYLGRIPSDADRFNSTAIVSALGRGDGPVLSEAPSLALAAGKPIVGNATHLRNLYVAGLWDPTSLVADVDARRFDTIVLSAQLYPEPVLAAIGRSYYVVQSLRVGPATYLVLLPGG